MTFLLLLASFPALFAAFYFIDAVKLLVRGYIVYMPAEPEPPVLYIERGKGKIVFDMSPESDQKSRFYLVHIPKQTWSQSVPTWAAGRRSEIITRVKKELSRDKSIRVED